MRLQAILTWPGFAAGASQRPCPLQPWACGPPCAPSPGSACTVGVAPSELPLSVPANASLPQQQRLPAGLPPGRAAVVPDFRVLTCLQKSLHQHPDRADDMSASEMYIIKYNCNNRCPASATHCQLSLLALIHVLEQGETHGGLAVVDLLIKVQIKAGDLTSWLAYWPAVAV